MRLIIIRHADPDYSIDSLTPEGWKQAEALSDELVKINDECGGIKAFYVSPLGRAKDTASVTLKKLNRTAEECEWLKEFPVKVQRPDTLNPDRVAWDWLPQDWTGIPEFYHPELWKEVPEMKHAGAGEEYDRVCKKFDALLERHGYRRYDGEKGHYYEAIQPNNDTIVLICHYGLECVLVSHLMSISPMIPWHHLCASPSSLTSFYTEERREGIASFRAGTFGDISHLYAKGMAPSFSARFCERYSDWNQRHDGPL